MQLQPNLENILQKVNNFINIDKHRHVYAEHFSNLRDNIFKNLKTNKVFCYLLNGYHLEGSYGDNVKVSLPNEFDLVFHISFPERFLINVKKDDKLPGNVYLDFTTVLQKIKHEKQHEENLKHLSKWLDENSQLKIEKFQLFIQECFKNALTEMGNEITYNGMTSRLKYKRVGPAHTIYVEALNLNYSVDFVPGVLLSAKQSIIPHIDGNWQAIPKPSKTNQHKHNSFRASYYQQEHKLIQNKQHLKNAFRMLKKFRDIKSNMNKMKSYFIKTLFLFKVERENSSYWSKPLSEIIIDMFKDLEKSLQDENLPFFWDQKLNLYDRYSSRLLREMLSCVEKARETLESASTQITIPLQNRVYCIFLTKPERDCFMPDNQKPSTNGHVAQIIEISTLAQNAALDKTTCEARKKDDASIEPFDERMNDIKSACILS